MLTVDKTETPPPEEPFYHSNPKYICACGIHVKKGVLYMAGALIVAAILLIIFSLSMAIYSWSIVGIVLIFLCALVIYANRTERENFYLPFLLFAVLFALTTAAFATFLIIMLLQTPHFWQNYASFVFTHTHDAKNEGEGRIVSAILLAVTLILMGLAVWCSMITLRAFHYFKAKYIARHPSKVYASDSNGTNGNGTVEVVTVVETAA
jgi:hypothetical protein